MTQKDTLDAELSSHSRSGWLHALWCMLSRWFLQWFSWWSSPGEDCDTAMQKERHRVLWGNAIQVMTPRRKARKIRMRRTLSNMKNIKNLKEKEEKGERGEKNQ